MRTGWIAATTAGLLLGLAGPASAQETQYQLTVNVIGPDGKPAKEAELWLGPLDAVGDPESFTVTNGRITIRRPKGRYLLDTDLTTKAGDVYRILQPELRISGATTAVVDARVAKQIATRVPRATAREVLLDVNYEAHYGDSGLANTVSTEGGKRLFTAQVGPLPAGMTITSQISSHWAVPGPKRDFADTPYMYNLSRKIQGKFPTGDQRIVRDRELIKVVAQHTKTTGHQLTKTIAPGESKIGGATAEFHFRNASTVTQYMDPIKWDTFLEEFDGDRGAGLFSFEQPPSVDKRWNAAPFYPTWRDFGRAERREDKLNFTLMPHSDQDGHSGGSSLDTESMKLYRDGRLIESSTSLSLQAIGLPAKTANYRLTAVFSRPSWSPLSAHSSATWTFRSRASVGDTDLPLQTIRFRPPVDAANLVRRTPVTVLPLQADSRPGVPPAKSAQLQYSGDGGKSWRRATVVRRSNGTFVAVFPAPKGTYVSLRAQLTGTTGSTVDQTLIQAYRLK